MATIDGIKASYHAESGKINGIPEREFAQFNLPMGMKGNGKKGHNSGKLATESLNSKINRDFDATTGMIK